MTTARFGQIDHRRLDASTILIAGAGAQAGPGASQPAALVAQDGAAGAPMFRGNAARTGEMPGPGPDGSNGVEAIWIFAAGDEVEIRGSPAVVDGVVYVGSGDANLYAVTAEDGTERWRWDTNTAILSSPAVVDGVVYIGSRDGNLYAFGADDGTERWQLAGGNVDSSPAVVDGVVYVGRWPSNLHAIGARVPRLGVGGTARIIETTSLRGGPSSTTVERGEFSENTVVTITAEAVITGEITCWPVTVNESGA